MDAMRVEADRMLVCARVRMSFEGELSGLCAVFDFDFSMTSAVRERRAGVGGRIDSEALVRFREGVYGISSEASKEALIVRFCVYGGLWSEIGRLAGLLL
jgi:hypothetical protein